MPRVRHGGGGAFFFLLFILFLFIDTFIFRIQPQAKRMTGEETDAAVVEAGAARREGRRGIKALRLPKQNKQEYWRGQPVKKH